ncbi:MAG TPA: RecX family transcriptional regulator [Solirubrobacterales bacterium]|nr:RecX family transcriptional regulator [Solirubrobacterales bacterium]
MRGKRPRPPRVPEDPSSEKLAYGKALARLARREMSAAEVRRGLLRDGFAETAVDGALGRLQDQRYLDDSRLGERFARSRLADRGLGRNRVRQALVQKGLSRGIIDGSLRAALADVSEADAIDRLARRYWRQKSGHVPERRLKGLWAFLIRRGFPAGLVGDRLRALWPRWGDALAGLEPVEPDE